MIATDPLSLVFLFCAVFSGGFILVATMLGLADDAHLGHLHLGGHLGDVHGHLEGHAAHSPQPHGMGHDAPTTAGGDGLGVWHFISATLGSLANLYSILTWLFTFGVLGYLLHNFTNVGPFLSLAFPLVLGGAFGIAVSSIMARLFRTSEASLLDADSSRLEGRLGEVSMAIREGGTGEIIYTTKAGIRQSVGARSANGQPILNGAQVVILGYQDGIASVQTWEQFMLDVRTGRPISGLLPPLP